jgi:hypothetical protein
MASLIIAKQGEDPQPANAPLHVDGLRGSHAAGRYLHFDYSVLNNSVPGHADNRLESFPY